MNESTHDDKNDDQEVSEGTEALQDIADQVESEREKRGHSEYQEPADPGEQVIPGGADAGEDH